MEEEEDFFNEAEYKRGFNHGAIMATYEIDLANHLMESGLVLDNDFTSGFYHGIAQTQQERESERLSQVEEAKTEEVEDKEEDRESERLAELDEIRGTDIDDMEEELEDDEPTDSATDIETDRMNELDSLRDSYDKDTDRDITS